jgi:hypothetical protein
MLVYVEPVSEAVILGAGVLPEWLTEGSGVKCRGLLTPYGTLDYFMTQQGGVVTARIEGDLVPPEGGLVIRSPFSGPLRLATVNGVPAEQGKPGEITVRSLPATVKFSP